MADTPCAPLAGYFFWVGFAFPAAEGLLFQADGPDTARPDRLFIAVRADRFLLYLEKGFDALPRALTERPDYQTRILQGPGRTLELCCPRQTGADSLHSGYFRVTLHPPGQPPRCCTGSLSIAPPTAYAAGLTRFSALQTLFRGLRLQAEFPSAGQPTRPCPN